MTPETEQAPTGYPRRPRLSPGVTTPPRMSPTDMRSPVRNADGRVRSEESVRPVELVGEAAPTGRRGAVARPPRPESAVAAKHVREERSIVAAVPYLAVLICVIVGVYVAWQHGSAGGGKGGVIGGVALLGAAVLRMVLPARLAGLLGARKRVTDVLTLAVLGGGLLVAGLVLPH